MAKNIVIALLALLTLMSFTFAYYQRTLTEQALVLAEANAEQARKMEMEALAQAQRAQEQAAIAMARSEELVKRLEEELKKGKKK